MGQNIIDIGFNYKQTEADKDRVIKAMQEVFDFAERAGKVKISFGSGVQEFKKLNEEVKKIVQELSRITKEYNSVLKTNADEHKKTAQAVALEAKANNDNAQATLAEAKAKTEAAKADQVKQKSSESVAKQMQAEKKMTDEITNDYLQLSKAYNDAALKAKNYALRLGETHPVTIEAVKNAKSMHDILLRVDNAVGQNGRNVGNYKSHWDGLGMSFAQISRELPSLTISVQQFALAISNNLPMMADEIAKAKVEIAALKAEGKEAPSLFSRIAGAMFSWQVGLSVIILLITAFSGKIAEWVGGLLDTEAAQKKLREQQEQLNDALREQLELEKRIRGAFQTDLGQTQKSKNDLAFAQAGNKERLKTLQLEQQITDEQFRKADAEFQARGGYDIMQNKAKELLEAQVKYDEKLKEYQDVINNPEKYDKEVLGMGKSADDVAKNVKEELDGSKKILDQKVEDFNDVKKINEDYATTKNAMQAKELEMQAYIEAEKRKLILETTRKDVDLNEDKNNRILSSDRKNLYEKLQAVRNNEKEKKRLINAELNDVLNNPSSSSADKSIANSNASVQRIKAEREAGEQIFNITQEWENRRTAAVYEANKLRIEQDAKFAQEYYDNEKNNLQHRLGAVNKYTEDQKQLVLDEYKHEKELLDQKAHTNEEEILLEAHKDVKLIELTASTYKTIDGIIKAHFNKMREEQLKSLSKITGTNAIDIGNLEIYAADLKALNKLLRDKKISVNKYNEERKNLDDNYAQLSLQSQIEKEKELIRQKQYLGESTLDDEKRLAEIQIQLDDDVTKKKLLNRQKIKEAEQQLAEEIIKLFSTIISAGYERELNAIQEKEDKSNEYYSQELENIRNSSLSEQDKANQTIQLQAEQKAQQDKFDAEKRRVQERQARFDKAIAIAGIIEHTALGITAALSSIPPDIPLSLLIGAIGAVQIASVLAKPIPKYATYTDNHPGGLAWVGDGGEHELIELPTGKSFVSPDTDTLLNLPAGTKVKPVPDDMINAALNNSMIKSTAAMLLGSKQIEAKQNQVKDLTVWQTNQLVKAITKNKPVVKVNGGLTDSQVELKIRTQNWRNRN